MKETLGWGVIGTGIIAGDFAEALERSSRCRIVNAVGSSVAKGRAFRERFRLPRSSASIDELLGDPAVDAVYVATPHPQHEANALACIEAGRPVLCEKPLTLNATSAARLLDAARARRVFLLEAFMYRCHPVVTDLLGRLRDGVIGKLRHVRSDFAYRSARDASSRLFDPAQGGGAILDLGGYPMSFARLVAGVAEDLPFAEPAELRGHGFVGPLGADEFATALLRFRSGMTAALTCAVHHQGGTQSEIFGDDGRIVLPSPWVPGGERHGLEASYTLHRYGHAPEMIRVPARLGVYALEAEWVADSLPALEARWPAMTWADTLGNMRALDAWLAGAHARQT
jgi:predicted dehydrogenase